MFQMCSWSTFYLGMNTTAKTEQQLLLCSSQDNGDVVCVSIIYKQWIKGDRTNEESQLMWWQSQDMLLFDQIMIHNKCKILIITCSKILSSGRMLFITPHNDFLERKPSNHKYWYLMHSIQLFRADYYVTWSEKQ